MLSNSTKVERAGIEKIWLGIVWLVPRVVASQSEHKCISNQSLSLSRSKTYSNQIVSRQPDINRPIERSQTSASCESERSDWRRTSSSRGARETQAMMESILRVRSMRDLFLTHRQHQVIQSMSARERERESIGNRRRRRREAHDTHRLTRLESAPPSAEEIDPRKPRFPDSCLCTQVQVRRRPQPRE